MDVVNLMDDDSLVLNRDNLHKIESLLGTAIINDNITTVTIEPYNGIKYLGNMYGLLHNVLNIPNLGIYINIRINNYKSSLDYDGRLTLNILNPDTTKKIIDILSDE